MLTIFLSLILTTQASYPAGKDPRGVAVIDVNGDGALDVVTANAASKDLTVLLGDGTGRFKSGPTSAVPLEPAWMATADVNRDGHPDLALAEHETYRAAVLLGDGKGRFRLAPGSPFPILRTTPRHIHGLVFGDFNRDGHVDLVSGNNADRSVSVLLGDGRGRFVQAPGSPVSIERITAGVTAGDLDGDGCPDVAAPGEGAADVTILLGDGKGGLRVLEPRIPVPTSANVVAIGDVNRDRVPDLIVGHNESALVTILLGDGRGRFSTRPALDSGHLPRQPVLADLNGDGANDLVLLDTQNGRVTLWEGDGRGSFRAMRSSPRTVGKAPMALALANLARDGRRWIVTADSGSGTVTVLALDPK